MNHVITQSVASVFSRPADDNFESMERLLEVADEEMRESRTVKVNGADLTYSAHSGKFFLNVNGESLPLTNYSMTQVAGMAKIQTHVLERLHKRERDDLVVDNINTLFPNDRSETKFILIRDRYSDIGIESTARAINGGAYARLWDSQVFSEMEDLLMPRGFTPSLPKLASEAMRNGFMHGLSTGLFRGDQCSFGFFFVANDQLDGDDEDLGGLQPGMMVWNSEVGARSFGFHSFYYHKKSGSIIIWTPALQGRKRFVHRGNNLLKGFKEEFIPTVEDVAVNYEARYVDDIKTFNVAANTPFAVDRGAAIQRLHKDFKMSAVNARAVLDATLLEQNSYGLPLSVWNIALGIAWEAGQTGRAESLVDSTMIATKVMRTLLKV